MATTAACGRKYDRKGVHCLCLGFLLEGGLGVLVFIYIYTPTLVAKGYTHFVSLFKLVSDIYEQYRL